MEPVEPSLPNKNELTKKQELNNHVVSMRKFVRQARVHVINKLAKEVKRLRERKGPENIQVKAKRKAERFLDELKVLKHLEQDKVSIYALQDQKTLEESLQSSESTTETRALARLSHHPIVQTQVKKYRDQNPHWILQIPVLLEKTKEKQKLTLKKAEKREKAKEVKVAPPASNIEIESDADSGSEIVEDIDSDVDSGSSEIVEDIDTEAVQVRKSVKPLPAVVEPPKKAKPAKKIPIPVSKLGRVEGTVKIQILENLEDLDKEFVVKRPKIVLDTEEAPLKKRPRSSFFVGGVDEPETVEEKHGLKRIKPAALNTNQNSEPKPLFRKGKLIKPMNRAARREQIHGKPQRNFQKSNNFNSNPNRAPVAKRQFERPTRTETAPVPVTPAEKLHPSWEAKKRSQVSLAAFKGKKTTFGDDD